MCLFNDLGPKEPSEPLTLQDALARHKSSFIKASQARQKEVKVHAGTKSQAGTAFALTIKNWQKAKLEAQQKNRTKGKKGVARSPIVDLLASLQSGPTGYRVVLEACLFLQAGLDVNFCCLSLVR